MCGQAHDNLPGECICIPDIFKNNVPDGDINFIVLMIVCKNRRGCGCVKLCQYGVAGLQFGQRGGEKDRACEGKVFDTERSGASFTANQCQGLAVVKNYVAGV